MPPTPSLLPFRTLPIALPRCRARLEALVRDLLREERERQEDRTRGAQAVKDVCKRFGRVVAKPRGGEDSAKTAVNWIIS